MVTVNLSFFVVCINIGVTLVLRTGQNWVVFAILVVPVSCHVVVAGVGVGATWMYWVGAAVAQLRVWWRSVASGNRAAAVASVVVASGVGVGVLRRATSHEKLALGVAVVVPTGGQGQAPG